MCYTLFLLCFGFYMVSYTCMKNVINAWVCLLGMGIFLLSGCVSSDDGVRRIRVTGAPEYRYQATSVRRIGTVSGQVSRSVGPVGRSVFAAAGFSVVQGIAVFGQSLGRSFVGAGGIKPLLGAVLYVPASALSAIR